MYSTSLSRPERERGFVLAMVANPLFSRPGHASLVPAVVRELPGGRRLIKVNHPEAYPEYALQQYGAYEEGEEPRWHSLFVSTPDLEQALRLAVSPAVLEPPGGRAVLPAASTLAVRCPRCSWRQVLEAAYLVVGDIRRCDGCDTSSPVEEWADINE